MRKWVTSMNFLLWWDLLWQRSKVCLCYTIFIIVKAMKNIWPVSLTDSCVMLKVYSQYKSIQLNYTNLVNKSVHYYCYTAMIVTNVSIVTQCNHFNCHNLNFTSIHLILIIIKISKLFNTGFPRAHTFAGSQLILLRYFWHVELYWHESNIFVFWSRLC